MPRFKQSIGAIAAAVLVFGCVRAVAAAPRRPELPAIKLNAANAVPACVTPDRMMSHLALRNGALDPKYRGIAADYKKHGDTLRIRWDWAFYQMLHETNYLKFRRGDGSPGDVKPRQNNFAGLGATGNGVQGDSFADVSTGVLAHLQHLVAYSGDNVPDALAKRTREYQHVIANQSRRLGRPVRYDDLTQRWAADASYAASMEIIGGRYQNEFCNDNSPIVAAKPTPKTAVSAAEKPQSLALQSAQPLKRLTERTPTRVAVAQRNVGEIVRTIPPVMQAQQVVATPPLAGPTPPAPSAATAGAAPTAQTTTTVAAAKVCRVMMASFGGTAAVLIRSETEASITLTALEVEASQDTAQAQRYMDVHARGGTVVGRFKSRGDAVETGYKRCDDGKP